MECQKQRKRIRLPDYSYSSKGAYFITICTNKRMPYLGKIVSNTPIGAPDVILSKIGLITQDNISRICLAYPNVTVDNFVIMPNHIHLLLQVRMSSDNTDCSRDKMLISKVIQSFKSSVTRQISCEVKPLWQSRYYDHVIRNEQDYLRTWKYIDDNPAVWLEDDYYINI